MVFMGSFFVCTFDLEQNEKNHTGTFVQKNIVPKFLELYFFFGIIFFFWNYIFFGFFLFFLIFYFLLVYFSFFF